MPHPAQHLLLRPTWLLLAALALPAAGPRAQLAYYSFGPGVVDAGDLTGTSVAFLGDVSGDGADDLVIGAPNDEDNGIDSGTVYVVTGGSPSQVVYEIHGAAGDNCGAAVANAGDVDGDGRDDFAVGFPGADTGVFPFVQHDVGRVRVYSGATGALIWTLTGPKQGGRFGSTVAGGRDTDGDGHCEILVGAPSWDVDEPANNGSNEGWAGLYWGDNGTLARAYVSTGAGDRLGSAVALLDSLDGDPRADVAIGSPGDDYLLGGLFLVLDGGRVDVYDGHSSALLFSRQGGFGDELGSSIARAGDTDADGVPEVLVGAPGHSADAGAAYLYEGGAGTLLGSFSGLGLTGGDRFGSAVAPLGDLDRDGHGDFAVGAPYGTGSIFSGYARIFSGATLSQYMFTAYGGTPGELFGSALAIGPGDPNGDGWPDLLAGRPYASTYGSAAGAASAFLFVQQQQNLGFQGPGSVGLSVVGTALSSGGQADLHVQGMKPLAPCWLVASPLLLKAPFKGGVLVPDPSVGALFAFVAGPTGLLYLPGLAGGGGPLDVAIQVIAKDAAQAKGYALSNAVNLHFLP